MSSSAVWAFCIAVLMSSVSVWVMAAIYVTVWCYKRVVAWAKSRNASQEDSNDTNFTRTGANKTIAYWQYTAIIPTKPEHFELTNHIICCTETHKFQPKRCECWILREFTQDGTQKMVNARFNIWTSSQTWILLVLWTLTRTFNSLNSSSAPLLPA